MFWKRKDDSDFSRTELEFLIRFRNGQDFKDIREDIWGQVLNLSKTILKFENQGLLKDADLIEKIEYCCKVTDLKEFLKKNGQTVSGRKNELAQKASTFKNDKFIKDIEKRRIISLTEAGIQKANEFLQFKLDERSEAEKSVLNFLENKDLQKACITMSEFEAKQVFPRGMGINWSSYNPKNDISALKEIFSTPPRILKDIKGDKIRQLQIAGAMGYLFGTSDNQRYLPSDFQTESHLSNEAAIRMMIFAGYHKRDMDGYLANEDVISGIQILACKDSCEECKKLHGKVFKLREAPFLPNEKCTCEKGCRCTYLPVVIGVKPPIEPSFD